MLALRLGPIGALLIVACAQQPAAPPANGPTAADVLAASRPDDWRAPEPENTLYLELASGRVILELAPHFAPGHAANIRALAREKYFDGLAILRVQENYVVQWGDPAETPARRRAIEAAQTSLPPEFARAAADLPFTVLPDGDVYAAQVGHSLGFPAARDPATGQAWLAHCYGMLGVGRDNSADSGSGAELYVVIGHAPRHLDRNITLAGRVLRGMERLTVLPRGTAPLGFYDRAAGQRVVPIQSVRVAADVPERHRTALEVLRTDTATWAAWVDARRVRREEWFLDKVGRIELCNVPIPVRDARR